MNRNLPKEDRSFTIKDYVRGVIPGTDFITDDVLLEVHTGMRKYKIANIKLNHLLLRILGAYGLGKESDWSNVIKNHPYSYKIILEAVKELERLNLVRFVEEDSITLTKFGDVLVISFQPELVKKINNVRAQYAEVAKEYAAREKMKNIADDNDAKIAYYHERHMCDGTCRENKAQGYATKPLGKTTIKNEPDRTDKMDASNVTEILMDLNRSCASLQFTISDLMISAGASDCGDGDIKMYMDTIHELAGNITDIENTLRELVKDED